MIDLRYSLRRASRALRLMASLPLLAGAVASTQADAQQAFHDPQEAVAALVKAAKVDGSKAVLDVLGPSGVDIVSSGDPVADTDARRAFLEALDKGYRVDMEKEDRAVLLIGTEQWPFPIPMVRDKGSWRFDTAAGRDEILYRRIGRNELSAIQTCLAYVDAQNEFADLSRTETGVATYAQRIVSRLGKKDGLYWPAELGGNSPLGALAARATAEGYKATGAQTPYHGYYYRILTRQGTNADGGAYDYVVDGKMIGGFALVAYPAEYENSGVMTFVVNHEGLVFQKDLGPRTIAIASRMAIFNPDKSWQRVQGAGIASGQ